MDDSVANMLSQLVDKIFAKPDRLASIQKQIDIVIYSLYNLTYDEVKIIGSNTPITRAEYEN